MFGRLRNRRPTAEPTVPIDWLEVDAGDTNEHPGLVTRLVKRSIDGMTIRCVFSPEEVVRAVDAINAIGDGWHSFPFGSMLGMPLNSIGSGSRDTTPYLDDTERCRPIYADVFGFDPHERLAAVLRPMADGLRLVPPTEDGRPYNPGNIRKYEPGMGGLKAHAGNEFIGIVGEGAMHHLISTTSVMDHMSYFVVLQPPKVGGELAVYGLLWEDHPDHDAPWANADRDASSFSGEPAHYPRPGPGDMILFGGGWRWHCVEAVGGPRPRITYGGFAGMARDRAEIRFWA